MASSTYNGWTNRSTWSTVLWLFNDENHYFLMRDTFKKRTPAPHFVEHFCRGIFGDKTPDRWTSMSEVNWNEVTQAIQEDFE